MTSRHNGMILPSASTSSSATTESSPRSPMQRRMMMMSSTTSPTEALVVEALTSMVQTSAPPPLPPPPLVQPSPGPPPPSRTMAVDHQSRREAPQEEASTTGPFSAAKNQPNNGTALTIDSSKNVALPSSAVAGTASAGTSNVCLPVKQNPATGAGAASSTSTTATTSTAASTVSVETTTAPLPSTTTTTTTTPGPKLTPAVASSSPAAKSPVVKPKKALTAVKPVLPARDRQPPKPLSRRERRRRLTASMPRPCLSHAPTLVELQSITFSDYVQKIVLGSAVPYEEDSDEDYSDEDGDNDGGNRSDDVDSLMSDEDWQTKPMPLAEGIAKVSLPDGFWPTESASWTRGDRTGRGPAWQPGTALGDYPLSAPIAQHVRGLAGVYEFSFVDKPPLHMAEFRDKADAYRKQHVGCAYDVFVKEEKEKEAQDDKSHDAKPPAPKVEETESSTRSRSKDDNVFKNEEERLEYLERFFWKRLGPTMPPAWYGADHEGTLFPEDDDATGWSLGQLDSCLHVLPKVPGVTSPYLYAGMWASVFCAHSEDMNLLSINYMHAGAPKIWYAIAPGTDAQRFESLCASSFAGTPSTMGCKEFLRHKRSLLSPKILQKAGIRYTTAIQRPGDAIITFPSGYHFGFNTGFNLAEATNFAVPEWIPFAWQARVCLCRPDSVRIDMNRLTALLQEFDHDQSRFRRKRLSWKEWSAQKYANRTHSQQQQRQQSQHQSPRSDKNKKRKVPLSEQQRKREFWIEVAKPIARSKRANAAPKKEKAAPKSPPEDEEAGRGKRRRKLTAKAAKWERELQKKKAAAEAVPEEASTIVVEEIWHLARPLPPRKAVQVGLRVLCLLPGTTMGYAPKNQWRTAGGSLKGPRQRQNPLHDDNDDDDDDDEKDSEGTGRRRKHVTDDEEELEEQCFMGQLVEISDDYARVHIDGLPRTEDVWMDFMNGNKVYLDGGRWDEEEAKETHGDGRSLPQLHFWEEMDSKRRCS